MSGMRDPLPCQFSDILEIWGNPQQVTAAFQQCQHYHQKVWIAQQMPVQSHGWCHTHARMCPYRASNCRVQGPPCIDWSPAGKQLGKEGPYLPTLLASGSKTESTETALAVVENAKNFPLDVVQDAYYGTNYSWAYTQQHPSLVGFECISRERTVFDRKHCRNCNGIVTLNRFNCF